jgi:hypothetical protein
MFYAQFVYLLFLFFYFNIHKVQICKIRCRLDMPSAHVPMVLCAI